MRKKDKTLYWIWKKCRGNKWEEKLKEVGVVSEEDVNGFLRLVGERDNAWENWELGDFVSKVLEICYKRQYIELDVGAVDGRICVGDYLDWDGVIYVKGDVDGTVGWYMEGGVIVIDGDVKGFVGWRMKGGLVVVDGNVEGGVGVWMEGGEIYVEGDVYGSVGHNMKGGVIVVEGNIKDKKWLLGLGKGGFVVNNGFVYFGREAS